MLVVNVVVVVVSQDDLRDPLAALDGAQRGLYVQGELVNKTPVLKELASDKRFHVYCSPLNAGAAAVIDEVARAFDNIA